jgi:integrase
LTEDEETLRVRWSDVDFKQEQITVRESKSGERRHIPMNEIVIQTLKSFAQRIDNQFVFVGEKPGESLRHQPYLPSAHGVGVFSKESLLPQGRGREFLLPSSS